MSISPSLSSFERWRKILARVESGEMPPKKEPRPPPAQVADVRGQALGATGCGGGEAAALDGRVVLRRLNRVEYENTVRDLFAVNVSVKEMLPEDAISHGFDNVGAALNVSPVLMERYLEAADAVLDGGPRAGASNWRARRSGSNLRFVPTWFLPALEAGRRRDPLPQQG